MITGSTASLTSIRLRGLALPGATDRQQGIVGFDQAALSRASVCCIGAGGLMAYIAPTLCRKGIGRLTLLDPDIVEAGNLNRQRFYRQDLGQFKAIKLAEHLQKECIAATDLRGYAFRLQKAVARGIDLACDVAVCGVDNNPARVFASQYFRRRGIPVIFAAVSRDADHGYVFVQEAAGPCLACLFPDIASDDWHPCPGTPAIADILQAVGALVVYAVDSLLMERPRPWNYRRTTLSGKSEEACTHVPVRPACCVCAPLRPLAKRR